MVVCTFNAAQAGSATLQLLTLAAWGATPRTDLNATLSVLDANGTVLRSAVGMTTSSGIAPFSVKLPVPGTYFVSLQPIGAGDPATTGYSTYGSRWVPSLFVSVWGSMLVQAGKLSRHSVCCPQTTESQQVLCCSASCCNRNGPRQQRMHC